MVMAVHKQKSENKKWLKFLSEALQMETVTSFQVVDFYLGLLQIFWQGLDLKVRVKFWRLSY